VLSARDARLFEDENDDEKFIHIRNKKTNNNS